MSPHIEPTTLQTYRQAASVLGRAFVNEPVSAAVYRSFSAERRARALTADFTSELAVGLRKGCPVHLAEDGRVVAAALIYPPGAYPLTAYDNWMFLLKSVVRNGWYDLRSWVKWCDEVDAVHPQKSHYYLEYIGVDPDRQGKGLGSQLLGHLAAHADQDGVGCYLENANPHNLPFYGRAGFEVIGEKIIIGLHAWFMWRKPL